ncbi:MAG: YitT family protein [Bacilli bacterium]|jgi:uncharacterized membrane-anchored protein YitT (DUF2179 family)|nr:YitT family protein [Bacilli bacterium]
MIYENKIKIKDLILIMLGSCIYAFGLVFINMQNNLAEGGVTGITLIIRALFKINPAYTSLAINIPLIIIGAKLLGKRSLLYTLVGTISLSVFLYIWQLLLFMININHDLLIAALLAGLFAGIGSGIVYRSGGTTGGADVISRILERKFGIGMGQSLFAFDIIVLTLSLCYIDIPHMMYTLIASFIFSKVVSAIQSGGYTVRGMIIVSDHNEEIANEIMDVLERGVTFLDGEGAYLKEKKKIIYLVLSPSEIMEVRRIIRDIDKRAFISIINVHEAIGEGFTYLRPTPYILRKNK